MHDPLLPHVLLVDDENDLRESLCVLLGFEGFRVSEAPGGAEALALLDGGAVPDVILLDYRMPGLNGGETLDAMRANGHRIPAVLVTAAADADRIAARHGFDAMLRKPVGPEQLASMIRRLLRRPPAAPD